MEIATATAQGDLSTNPDEVMDQISQWQQRRLGSMYPIVYFHALRLKMRDDRTVKTNHAWGGIDEFMAAQSAQPAQSAH